MNALTRLIRTEPTAVVTLLLVALQLAAAFGFAASDAQTAALTATANAVVTLLGGVVVRSQVSPVATAAVQDLDDEDVPDNPLTESET